MRLDKWLWHARFVKTRGLAQHLIEGGKVRLNGTKQSKASARISVGDELSFVAHERLHVIRIQALSTRRGPATEAQSLYKVLEQAQDLRPKAPQGQRQSGTGRPSKKQRRQIDQFRHSDLPFDP